MFIYNDGIHGTELWTSNGTASGTKLIKDINSNTGSGNVGSPFTFKGILYFHADDGIHGTELWASDNTPENTRMLKDIAPGASDSYPDSFTVFQERLYFSTRDGLWVTDGTSDGTVKVYDIESPYSLVAVNDHLCFLANDSISAFPRAAAASSSSSSVPSSPGSHGLEVWCSDGTSEGTYLLKDINPSQGYSISSYLHVIGDKFYFSADDGIHGYELWRSDGTEEGTKMVTDLYPGAENGVNSFNPVLYDGRFYFGGFSEKGGAVYQSDGSAENTIIFKKGDETFGYWNSRFAAVADGRLYFTFWEDGHYRLYRSDGTPAGTEKLREDLDGDLVSDGHSLYVINHAYDAKTIPVPGNSVTKGIYSLDKTSGETTKLYEVLYDPNDTKDNEEPVILEQTLWNGALYFSTADNNHLLLHKTDGTPEGTSVVADVLFYGTVSDLRSHFHMSFEAFDERLFFSFKDTYHNEALWSSDGTPENTAVFKDTNPITDNGTSNPNGKWFSGKYYFQSFGGIYVTDGNETGTRLFYPFATYDNMNDALITDDFMLIGTNHSLIAVHQDDDNPVLITNSKDINSFYFTGEFHLNCFHYYFKYTYPDWHLFRTDGWTVQTVSTGIGISGPPKQQNDKFYFIGESAQYGSELFVTDGTSTGTHIVKDINPGSANAVVQRVPNDFGGFDIFDYRSELFELDGNLIFGASSGEKSYALYKSDGTQEGTLKITDIPMGEIADAEILNHKLFFTITTKAFGKQLWCSDGSDSGTFKFEDENISNLFTFGPNQKLYYTVTADSHSAIWESDGTIMGTHTIYEYTAPTFFHLFSENNDSILFKLSSQDKNTHNRMYKLYGFDKRSGKMNELYSSFKQLKNECTLGNSVLFTDSAAGSKLYVSDGTADGTSELYSDEKNRTLILNGCHRLDEGYIIDLRHRENNSYKKELLFVDDALTSTTPALTQQ